MLSPLARRRAGALLVTALWLLAGLPHMAQAQMLLSEQYFQPASRQTTPALARLGEQAPAPTAAAQPMPVTQDNPQESGSLLELGRGLWQRLSTSLHMPHDPAASMDGSAHAAAAPVTTLTPTPNSAQAPHANLFGPTASRHSAPRPTASASVAAGPSAPNFQRQESHISGAAALSGMYPSPHIIPDAPAPAPAAATFGPARPPLTAATRLEIAASAKAASALPAAGTASTDDAADIDELLDDTPAIIGINLLEPPKDLWQRVRNGFAMSDLDSPLVAAQQAWYLNRPGVLKNVLNRGRRYLYFIVEELEKRGMPTELALLPMVESSYNPMAYSPAHASGLWQFIPSTGKNYQLQQNGWQDQRRDIIASTGAALEYLQYIYELHGDWHLALASYNWGEGAVGRAIARNRSLGMPTDYASLRMPDETRYYVPKLQALKNIIAQPELFGLSIDPIANQPYFDTVDLSRHIDISIAAKLADMPLQEFLALNPSYNRPMMPADSDTPIVLPTDKVDTFLANLEQYAAQDKPLTHWDTHVLKRGESLNSLAKRHGLSLAYLRRINGLTARSRVAPGATLMVPGKDAPLAAIKNSYLPELPVAAKTKRSKAQRQVAKRGKGKAASSHKSSRASRSKSAARAKAKAPARKKLARRQR